MRAENFRNRSEMVDDKSEQFLKLLVSLGGYCTVAHGEELKLALTGRQARGHLRRLERLGFLRRVAAYPVVYQVTKSTTHHLARDCAVRRSHPLPTVQHRLAAVDFYVAARKWPAEFIFDHEQKIATFTDNGCPAGVLPQHGGRPYLREEFMLWPPDGRLGIAIVDRADIGALSQMLNLVRRFAPVLRHLGDGILDLLIATGDERRYYLYRRLVKHPRVIAAWPREFEFAIRPYLILRSTPPVAALLCPACNRRQFQPESTQDHNPEQPRQRRRAPRFPKLNQKHPTQSLTPIHCDLID